MTSIEAKDSETEDGEINDALDDPDYDDNCNIKHKFHLETVDNFNIKEKSNQTKPEILNGKDNLNGSRSIKSGYNITKEACQQYLSGYIHNLIASQEVPKNITISQFKKYTEISKQTDVMNMVTEAVKHSGNPGTRKSDILSDKEIINMLSSSQLNGLFSLERDQLLKFVRYSIDQNIIKIPTIQPQLSMKRKLNSIENSNIKKPRTDYVIKLEEELISESESEILIESDDNDCDENLVMKARKLEQERLNNLAIESQIKTEEIISNNSKELNNKNMGNQFIKISCSGSSSVISCASKALSTITSDYKSTLKPEEYSPPEYLELTDPVNDKISCSLTNIYKKMYKASVKMKNMPNTKSKEHQTAYNDYCQFYNEYQRVYSIYQNSRDFQSVKPREDNFRETNSSISCGFIPENIEITQKKVSVDKREYGYLWLSNLSCDTRADVLYDLFSKQGPVRKVRVFEYNQSDLPVYFALVCMKNVSDCYSAIDQLNDHLIIDKNIQIKQIFLPSDISEFR